MLNIGVVLSNIRDRIFKSGENFSDKEKVNNLKYEAKYKTKIRKKKKKSAEAQKMAVKTRECPVEVMKNNDTQKCFQIKSYSNLRVSSKLKIHNRIKSTGPKLHRRIPKDILPPILTGDQESRTTYSSYEDPTKMSNREEFKNKAVLRQRETRNNKLKMIKENSDDFFVENNKMDELKTTRRKIFSEDICKNNIDLYKNNLSSNKDNKMQLETLSSVKELFRGSFNSQTLQNPEVYGVYNTISKLKMIYKDKCTNELDEKGNCSCNACGAMQVIYDSMKRPLPFEIYEGTRPPGIRKKMPRRKVSRCIVPATPDSVTPQVSPVITPETSFWNRPGSSTQPDGIALKEVLDRLQRIEDRLSALEENSVRKTWKKKKKRDTYDMYTQCSYKNSKPCQHIDSFKKRETINRGIQTSNKNLECRKEIDAIHSDNQIDSFHDAIDQRILTRLRSEEWTTPSESHTKISRSYTNDSIEVGKKNLRKKRNECQHKNKMLYYNSNSNIWKTSENTTDFNSLEVQISKPTNTAEKKDKSKVKEKEVKHSNIAYAFVRNLQKALKKNGETLPQEKKREATVALDHTMQGKKEILFRLPWNEFVNMFKKAEGELEIDSSESANSTLGDDQFIREKIQQLDEMNKRLIQLRKERNKEHTSMS